MAAFTSGAKLLKALQDTGCGESKIAVGLKVLADAHAKVGSPVDVTAEVMLHALMAGIPEEQNISRDKLRSLYETGKYEGPRREPTVLEVTLNPALYVPKVETVDPAIVAQESVEKLRQEMAQQALRHQQEMADLRAELDLQREMQTAMQTVPPQDHGDEM